MHTRHTLTLDHETWDITLDGSGHIAITSGAAATAQNVANECRLFTSDAYFAQDRGTPYFAVQLGLRQNPAILRSYLRQAALRVEDVNEITSIELAGYNAETRVLSGIIQFTTVEDATNVSISTEL